MKFKISSLKKNPYNNDKKRIQYKLFRLYEGLGLEPRLNIPVLEPESLNQNSYCNDCLKSEPKFKKKFVKIGFFYTVIYLVFV